METVKETNLSNFELAKLRVLQVLPYATLLYAELREQTRWTYTARLAFLAWSPQDQR